MKGIPNNLQIDFEISMRHTVSHTPQLFPWDIGMPRGEIRAIGKQLCCGFSDDHNVADYCLLGFSCQPENILLKVRQHAKVKI